jgi:hypothetical protein
MPELTEQCFDALSHAAVQLSLLRHVSPRHQQQLVFLCQQLGKVRPFVAQIRQQYATSDCLRQFRRRAAIIQVARSQHRVNNAAIDVAQGVQFEAKEPTCTALAEISPFIAQQAHATRANGFTDGDRLGINQVKLATTREAGRFKQPTDERREPMQVSQPLLIRTKLRKGRGKVISNEMIGLFEGSDAEVALHQSNGDNFCICKSRLVIGRTTPVGQRDVGLKEVINEAVDFGHMIYNGRQMGRPPSVRLSLQLHSIHSRNYGDPAFQLNTQV